MKKPYIVDIIESKRRRVIVWAEDLTIAGERADELCKTGVISMEECKSTLGVKTQFRAEDFDLTRYAQFDAPDAIKEVPGSVLTETEAEARHQADAPAVDYGEVHKDLCISLCRPTPAVVSLKDGAQVEDMLMLARMDAAKFGKGKSFPRAHDTAITLLVDESGSMHGRRISAARNAALSLYLFCREAGIKCSVVGHTSEFNKIGSLCLAAYTDFDSEDCDEYSILKMSAKQDNRDGAALRYTGARLLERPEPHKMLIVISDGSPCAKGYFGRAAEIDTARAVEELRCQGVLVLAADLSCLELDHSHERIYGGGNIHVPNLDILPELLLDSVAKFVGDSADS